MFTSLKNKIKEETGSNIVVTAKQRHVSHSDNEQVKSRFPSAIIENSAVTTDDESGTNPVFSDMELRSQTIKLTSQVLELTTQLNKLQEEKSRIEKTNKSLLESSKFAQIQKDIIFEEQKQIQNLQESEINKLKNIITLRNEEYLNVTNALQKNQQQIEALNAELQVLRKHETIVADFQDELQKLRHSSYLEQNNLTSSLKAIQEENHHLKKQLQIVEVSRLDVISSLKTDEKIQALVQERKLLEKHLEETCLQLSDIKISWSMKNLALETQVNRLSNQVIEETTEKRTALEAQDQLKETVKKLENEVQNLKQQLQFKDDNILSLTQEVDKLNRSITTLKEENDQQLIYERSKADEFSNENTKLKSCLEAVEQQFGDCKQNSKVLTQSLSQQNAELQSKLDEMQNFLEMEKEEKLTALLKNAEISQSEEILRKDLRRERDEANELHEKNVELLHEIEEFKREITQTKLTVETLQTSLCQNDNQLKQFNELQNELNEKNRVIKTLNQRLIELKKTLQKEFHNTVVLKDDKLISNNTQALPMKSSIKKKSTCCNCDIENGRIVMDEVNFEYLKHVLVKFLTSKETEARHLIRAVATLLRLSHEEEKLLYDTHNWKMSWFGTRPNISNTQRSINTPPPTN